MEHGTFLEQIWNKKVLFLSSTFCFFIKISIEKNLQKNNPTYNTADRV
nr:MAG TPA: hypothetical protein [Caudoviricetes sp.]